MDILILAFEVAFEGSLAAAAGLLLMTYLAFARDEPGRAPGPDVHHG